VTAGEYLQNTVSMNISLNIQVQENVGNDMCADNCLKKPLSSRFPDKSHMDNLITRLLEAKNNPKVESRK